MQLCIAFVNKQWCEEAAAASSLDQCPPVCSDVAKNTAATLLTLNLRCHALTTYAAAWPQTDSTRLQL